jgi:UDP-3-O-[3-hydroxymyristoyl] glucosamine N-acyltransferase
VGRRCKIQSHAFVCELVTIGDECVGPGRSQSMATHTAWR